jgi:hypothetical protein
LHHGTLTFLTENGKRISVCLALSGHSSQMKP